MAELVQGIVKEVGITVRIEAVPQKDFATGYLQTGNFDATPFSWFGAGSPAAFFQPVFAQPKKNADGTPEVGLNYGRFGSKEVDDLFDKATQELDTTKEEELGNQIDALIWQLAHTIPLYQRPEIIATKSKLANFGAFGYASLFYENVGFTK